VGFKFDILDDDTFIALGLSIFGEDGFIYVTDLGVVDFDTTFLGALISLFWLFPLVFRGTIFRGALFRPNRRFSLFTLEPVDFVSQFLKLTFQVLVFPIKGFDKVE
jgi:hypothetical protein